MTNPKILASDLEVVLDPDAPEDVKKRVEATIRRQLTELYHQGQHYDDPRRIQIVCHCGKKVPLFTAYKCFFCKVWLCKDCAEVHFATEEDEDDGGVRDRAEET
jgi:hypothetical protein